MEQPSPLSQIPAPEVPKEPTTSLLARLLNVFAIPGSVFEEVKTTRKSPGNWLLPALLAGVAASLVVVALVSRPAFLDQMRAKQAEHFDQEVKAGAMTRQDADQALAIGEKFMTPAVIKTFCVLVWITISYISVFGWGLVVWFLGRRYLGARFPYLKAVEVAGLASMISALGRVVKLLLVINLGKMFSTRSLGLALGDYNPDDPSYLLLVTMNIFQFWFIALLAVGLSRLANVILPRAMFLLLIVWMLGATLLITLGLGVLVL